jgi:hypothetical protein
MFNEQINELVRDLKTLPNHAIAYATNWWVRKNAASFAILQTEDFNLSEFAKYGECECIINKSVHPEIATSWNEDRSLIDRVIETSLLDVVWNEHDITALRISWKEEFCQVRTTWLIHSDQSVLDDFFTTVSQWQPPTEPSVEVFQDGHWAPSRTLYKSIKIATIENLILTPGLMDELRLDLQQFFGSKDVYDRYGIPWKRGVLISGPPGNGKTHAVKALINWLDKPSLYVKSLKSKHYTEHQMMNSVFSRARSIAPCILVFEDLESIVTPLNRSYFLNELDGFAMNTGIVVVATTNHPELLDPAITERPSRFDRKYSFDLPGFDERVRYLEAWNAKNEPELQLSDSGVVSVALETDGFSFAFLKELALASMLRWINSFEKPSMEVVMSGQVQVLRTQMANKVPPLPDLLIDPNIGVEAEDED